MELIDIAVLLAAKGSTFTKRSLTARVWVLLESRDPLKSFTSDRILDAIDRAIVARLLLWDEDSKCATLSPRGREALVGCRQSVSGISALLYLL